jgi:tetratricopeptide (TPR) repeat protein
MRWSARIRLLIILAVCVAFHGGAMTIPEIVAKAKPAVVQVIASDANWSPVRTGTGFFVGADGDLLTNFHVIQGAAHISARTNKGAIFVFEKLIAGSADSDVALLKFQGTDLDYLKIGNSTNAVEGETVLVIGSPEGLQGTVSNGIISAFRENRSYIQITAPVSPGSSGSPVLDETGQVIGMATLVAKEGQNLNFAISAEVIEAVVRSGLTQAKPAPSGAPIPMPTLAVPDESQDLEKYTEIIRLNPNNAYAYWNRGEIYLDLKQYGEAINDFTQGLSLKSDLTAVTGMHMSRARAYCELRQYEKAIGDDTSLIALRPNDYNGYQRRGLIYHRLNQYDKAISDYSEAIQRHPSDQWDLAETYRMRAETYDALGDFGREIADYTEAIQLFPKGGQEGEYYKARGLAYQHRKQYDKAIADFTQAVRFNADDADTYFERAKAYSVLGNYSGAIADFSEVLRLKPVQVEPGQAVDDVDVSRAEVYYELGDYCSTVAFCSDAIRLSPSNMFAYFYRGLGYFGLKEYKKAIDDYSAAIQLWPGYSAAYESRARAYQSMGNVNKANADFKKAEQIRNSR